MNEIDELCRKLDGLKRIALRQDNEEAFREMLPTTASESSLQSKKAEEAEDFDQIGGS